MEEMVYNLIEKMYIEVTGKFDHLEQRLKDIEQRMDQVEEINQRLDRLEVKIDALADKVERHDIKINVIEGGRKAMTI